MVMRRILSAFATATAIGLVSGSIAFASPTTPPYTVTVAEGAATNPSVSTFTGTVSGGVANIGTNPDSDTSTLISSWVAAVDGNPVTISFSQEQDYFGLLWGSPDGINTLTFYNGTTPIASYTGWELSAPGNGPQSEGLLPNGLVAGQYGGGYVTFTATSSADDFTKVVLSEPGSTNFESANYSSAAAAPEPAIWSMLMLGVGAIGFTMRRRKSLAASAA